MSLPWESVSQRFRKRIAEPVCELARNDKILTGKNEKDRKKPSDLSDGFYSVCVHQASLFSLMVMLLFLLAALFL